MLLFNAKGERELSHILKFKNILCYYSTALAGATNAGRLLFKNILCYYSTDKRKHSLSILIYLKTSYVTIQLILHLSLIDCHFHLKTSYVTIQQNVNLASAQLLSFKNILCYYSTNFPFECLQNFSNLKTSYVTIQQREVAPVQQEKIFKNILCYYSTHVFTSLFAYTAPKSPHIFYILSIFPNHHTYFHLFLKTAIFPDKIRLSAI